MDVEPLTPKEDARILRLVNQRFNEGRTEEGAEILVKWSFVKMMDEDPDRLPRLLLHGMMLSKGIVDGMLLARAIRWV